MTAPDAFEELARYYDAIMEHVDYERWVRITASLGEVVQAPVRHLDAACGTGVLLDRVRPWGWHCHGIDLSLAMLREGRKQGRTAPSAQANLCRLPFDNCFNLVTCLFDSINFLLEEAHVFQALRQIAGAMTEDGLLYFDSVTERMVTEHFEGQTWTEDNGGFETTWSNEYDREAGINDARLHISSGAEGVIRERVHAQNLLEDAVREAGLTLLGVFDAASWRPPQPRTVRLDFVAAKRPSVRTQRAFKKACQTIRFHY